MDGFDLGNFKCQISGNSLSFFVIFMNICSGSCPCANNFFQTLNLNHVIGCVIDCVPYIKTLIVCQMPSQKYEICFFIRKTCFVLDKFKFIYFHFLGPVIVIVEEVNGEIFLKFRRTSIVS